MNAKTSLRRRMFALLALGLPGLAAGHVAQLDEHQLVLAASDIVVADIIAASPRWSPRGNLIETVYTLAVEQQLKGAPGALRTLVQAGGTLAGETHGTCLQVDLEVGGRYLLFLDGASTLAPLVGAAQGALRVLPGPLAAVVPVNGGSPLLREAPAGRGVDEVLAQVRGLVLAHGQERMPPRQEDPFLPSKAFDPAAMRAAGSDLRPTDLVADAPDQPTAPAPASPAQVDAQAGGLTPRYRIERWPAPPVIFEAFPPTWSWSPHDQYMMSRWNHHRPDLFRVYTQPDGTWAWGNGVFELAGWPSEAQMLQQFGSGWGASTLGVTYYRWSSGPIIEADVALNPAYSWTLDNEYATRSSNAVHGFEQTMLHELGHSFGVQHPWETQDVWWDSVMNYAPKRFRFPVLATDDAAAVRGAYGVSPVHDGMVSFHRTADSTSSNHPVYTAGSFSPGLLAPGGSFSITGLKLENNGTDALVNPLVEVWLTPTRMSWSGAIFVGSRTINATIPTFNTYYFSTGTMFLPASVPAGSWYLALFLRDSADTVGHNNSAWSGYNEVLSVQLPPQVFRNGFE